MANIRRKSYDLLEMDEGRKRVLGIMASILASRHLKTTEDLTIAARVRAQNI